MGQNTQGGGRWGATLTPTTTLTPALPLWGDKCLDAQARAVRLSGVLRFWPSAMLCCGEDAPPTELFRPKNVHFTVYCILFFQYFMITSYSPAQLVRRDFNLCATFWTSHAVVTGVFPRPPQYVPSFLLSEGFSIPAFQLFMRVGLHRISPTHARELAASRFVRKSPLQDSNLRPRTQ